MSIAGILKKFAIIGRVAQMTAAIGKIGFGIMGRGSCLENKTCRCSPFFTGEDCSTYIGCPKTLDSRICMGMISANKLGKYESQKNQTPDFDTKPNENDETKSEENETDVDENPKEEENEEDEFKSEGEPFVDFCMEIVEKSEVENPENETKNEENTNEGKIRPFLIIGNIDCTLSVNRGRSECKFEAILLNFLVMFLFVQYLR